MASSSKQGYAKANAAGDKLQKQFDSIREQPVEDMTNIQNFPMRDEGVSRNARGVPGYYFQTSTAEDQRMKYRAAAANGGQLTEAAARDLGLEGQRVARDDVPAALLEGFKVDLTDKDVEFLEKRRRAKEQIEFDNWLTQVVDINDPSQNRWLQQMYPEFWARREKYIEDKINIEAKLAKMRLRGVKDISDYKLIYAIDQGYVAPATGPLWQGTPAGGRNFKKGYLSLYRSTRTKGGRSQVTSGHPRPATNYGILPADVGVSNL